MQFVLFSIFSSIEYIAMFAIMFALFRFEYRFYHVNVLFISLLMCFVSYSLRYGFDLANYSSLIQLFLMILIFALMYRQHLFYSGIMVIISFVIYGLIQAGIVQLLDLLGVMKIEAMLKEFSIEGKILQSLSAAVAMLVYYLIKLTKKGFSFIPHTNRVSIKFTGINLLILILILVQTALVGAMYYYANMNEVKGYYFLSGILVFLLGFLLYLSRKKDDLL